MRCALAVTAEKRNSSTGSATTRLDPRRRRAASSRSAPGRGRRADGLAEHEVLLLLDAGTPLVLADVVADGDEPEPAARPVLHVGAHDRATRARRRRRVASGRSTCTRPPTHMRWGNASISGRRRGWPSGPSCGGRHRRQEERPVPQQREHAGVEHRAGRRRGTRRAAPPARASRSVRAIGSNPVSASVGSVVAHREVTTRRCATTPSSCRRPISAGDRPSTSVEHLVGVHAEQRRRRGRHRRRRSGTASATPA